MSVVITSKTFYEDVEDLTGGGTSYLPGNVGEKIMVRTDFYVQWAIEDTLMVFDTTDDSITLGDVLQQLSWIEEGFKVGDTIQVTGTVSNNGSWTIESLTDRVIIVTGNLTNETDSSANVYGTTPVVALDYFSNTIPNSSQANYFSLTDPKHQQRWKASGLDASDVVTETNMLIASDSLGWVTANITDPLTGESDEVTVIGMGISADYKQQFRIDEFFYIAPVWTRSLINNFTEDSVPDYFTGTDCLKHITRIVGKFNANDPEVYHEGEEADVNGLTSWFNRNVEGTRPEYYVESVTYTDVLTSEVVDAPDFNRTTEVVVVIKSRNGVLANTTAICLMSAMLPLDEEDFTNTPDTVMRENLYMDRIVGELNTLTGDGEYFGTDYQVITDVTGVRTNGTTGSITFTIDLSTAGKAYLESKGSDNRKSTYWIAIKDPTITSTSDGQHLTLLPDVFDFEFNQDDDSLVEFYGDTFATFEYPDTTLNPYGDITGWEGDPIYNKVQFRVQGTEVSGVSPTIKTVKMQVVAVKTGEDDFIIEEEIIDTSQVRKLRTTPGLAQFAQTVDVNREREFHSADDDPFTRVALNRDSANDSGAMKAYVLEYGMVLRYEYWINSFPQKGVVGNTTNDEDVVKDVEEVVQRWNNFDAVNSWSLKLRFVVEVEGYDEAVTEFFAEKSMVSLAYSDDATEGDVIAGETKLYDELETEEIGMVVEDGITLVRTTFSMGAISEFTIISGNGNFNWSINGDTTDDVAFDTGNVAGTEALFQAMLNEFYPGFTIELSYDGGSGTWTGIVTSSAPGTIYDGIDPDITWSGLGSIGADPFSLQALSLPVDADGWYVWIFADVIGYAGIFNRRFASSELASEDDSPWSPTDDLGYAIDSYAQNVRINVYANYIEVEGYFDSTNFKNTGNIVFYSRLGYQYINT